LQKSNDPKKHMSTIITKKYANQVALVTDGSRGIGAPTANPGDTDSRSPSIKYQPKSTRYYFDVGIVSLCLSGDHTGGKYCLIEASLAPGMGVPRHTHTREEETYYVLAGELEVIVRDKVFTLREGDTLIAPRPLPPPAAQFWQHRESLSPHVLTFRVRGVPEGDGGPCT
jgi:mannose-6-phosphate isomerase-like protein (cupin superfamily)